MVKQFLVSLFHSSAIPYLQLVLPPATSSMKAPDLTGSLESESSPTGNVLSVWFLLYILFPISSSVLPAQVYCIWFYVLVTSFSCVSLHFVICLSFVFCLIPISLFFINPSVSFHLVPHASHLLYFTQ